MRIRARDPVYQYSTCRMRVLLLLFLMPLAFQCSGSVEILPGNQTAFLGRSVNFTCAAEDCSPLHWKINGNGSSENNTVANGLFFHPVVPANDGRSRVLTVNASVEFNNTGFCCYCAGGPFTLAIYSDEVYLSVIGPPLTPGPPRLKLLDATTIIIEWNDTTSRMGEKINYTVHVTSAHNGRKIKSWVAYSNSFSLSKSDVEGMAESCEELEFCVSARNEAGESKNSHCVKEGFPTVPRKFTSPVALEVLFTPKGVPKVGVSFQLPFMCDYQLFSYSITIKEIGEIEENCSQITLGPFMENGTTTSSKISFDISSNLTKDKQYTIAVDVYSEFGNVTSREAFETTFQSTDAQSQDLEPTESSTTFASTEDTGSDFTLVFVLIALMAGLVATVTVFISILLAVLLYKRWKLNPEMSKTVFSSPEMVNNPIYEGSIYETIDDKKLKSLTSQKSLKEHGYPSQLKQPMNTLHLPTEENLPQYDEMSPAAEDKPGSEVKDGNPYASARNTYSETECYIKMLRAAPDFENKYATIT